MAYTFNDENAKQAIESGHICLFFYVVYLSFFN